MAKFGKAIQAMRIKADLTLGAVAERLGVKVSYLSDVEHARKKPFAPELIAAFCRLVGETDFKGLERLAAAERSSVEITIGKDAAVNELTFALARTINSQQLDEDTVKRIMKVLEEKFA